MIDFKLRRFFIWVILMELAGAGLGVFFFSGITLNLVIGYLWVVVAHTLLIWALLPMWLRHRVKKSRTKESHNDLLTTPSGPGVAPSQA